MEQQETASIRFYTAGCMEFENYSECYENLTLAQAVDIYKKNTETECLQHPRHWV